jgi:ribosomal-protein-alanine N-acetyltransferase
MPKLYRRTRRTIVRPLRASDYEAWLTAHSVHLSPRNDWDRSARPHQKPLTRAAFRRILLSQEQDRRKDRFYTLGIFLRDGTMIGGVALMDVSRGVSQSAYLGYGIYNRWWGRGYGKEAVNACIEIGFTDLKLHRIEAGIEPRNRRSIALARSLKMRKEGKKMRALFLDNRWVDILIYTLTTEDRGLRFRGPRPQRVH